MHCWSSFSSLDFASLRHRIRIVRCVWMNARSEEKKTDMPCERTHWVEQKEKESKDLREKIKQKKTVFQYNLYNTGSCFVFFEKLITESDSLVSTHHFRFKFELFCRLRILCSVLLCQQKKSRHRLCASCKAYVCAVCIQRYGTDKRERKNERETEKKIENANLNCFFWEVSVCWVFFFFCYCFVLCTENKTNYRRNYENK